VEASKRASHRKPTRKVLPITPVIIHTLYLRFGDMDNLLDAIFVCMCLISCTNFLRISQCLNLRRHDIVIFDDYLKMFIEKSKTYQYREGQWCYMAKTSITTCPYSYLLKYFQVAGIQEDSSDFLFRSIRFDKKRKCNVLSQSQLSYGRAREILKSKLSEIGSNCAYSTHSFRSTSAANLNISQKGCSKCMADGSLTLLKMATYQIT
jgi:integrase